MPVWQLHQGHQQQLQGEAKAKDTRQEKLWQSPSKAQGFISHPQPPVIDSFPNGAFDLFVFSSHHIEDSGHWGIATVAAKLSSQSSFNFLCQLPWAEEEEEMSMKRGWWRASLRCSAGWTSLPALQDLTHSCWHPQIFQGLAKPWVLPPLITCCSLCCFGGFCHLHTFYFLCQFETPSARREQSPRCCPGAGAQKQDFHIME